MLAFLFDHIARGLDFHLRVIWEATERSSLGCKWHHLRAKTVLTLLRTE